jgi:hypothetical protein
MMQSTIDKHSHRLNPGPNATSQQYIEAAADYTNACCWEEQQTYRMVAKDGPDACFNPKQGVWCDRVCNLHSGDVYDLVSNSGLPHQAPAFNKVEGKAEGSRQVMPFEPTAYAVDPVPPMQDAGGDWPPYPGDHAADYMGEAIFADYSEANQAPNPGMSVWYQRVNYDFLTGVCATGEDAVNKHRNDWRAELGLTPLIDPSKPPAVG